MHGMVVQALQAVQLCSAMQWERQSTAHTLDDVWPTFGLYASFRMTEQFKYQGHLQAARLPTRGSS